MSSEAACISLPDIPVYSTIELELYPLLGPFHSNYLAVVAAKALACFLVIKGNPSKSVAIPVKAIANVYRHTLPTLISL
jgi:hypothetical protein